MNAIARVSLLTAPLLLAMACGDKTSANGEFGRINYSLYTDYYSQSESLTESGIVTGHQQRIYTTLTDKGWRKVKEAESLTHSVRPSNGVELYEIDAESGVKDILVRVDSPGTYLFETYEDDDLFERIELDFENPSSFELIAWTREPYADDFEKVENTGASVAVETGTQASFLPVPLNSAGTRLLGDLHADLSADPADAIVPDYTVKPYEEGVVAIPEPLNIYFVVPGTVGITLTDPVSKASSTMNFTVNSIN